MRTWFVAILVITVLGTLSCEKKSEPKRESQTWTKKDGDPPAIFSSAQVSGPGRMMTVLGETVRFSEQRWGPAIVDQGGLKTVENSDGRKIFGKIQYVFSPKDPIPLRLDELEKLDARKFQFLEQMKKRSAWFRSHEVLSDPQLVVLFDGSRPRVTYAIDLLTFPAGPVQRYWFSPNYRVIKKEIVSTGFDATAWIFPVSSHERIEEILLKDMIDGPILKSLRHQTASQSAYSASSDNKPWRFGLDDERFDQVQAFYYIQDGLDFYQNELGLTLPVLIEAQTSIGYPEKTNAAFTYSNQIRIGLGDGEVYGSLARDPSIVIHELGHVVVGMLARLPTQGEGGSLNEAFADFFTASHLGNPKMGTFSYLAGPFVRSLEQRIRYSEKNGGLYHDSLIVSGTLWEIRSALGADRAQKLALKTLLRMASADELKDFVPALRAAAAELLNESEMNSMNVILKERQWPD